MICVVFTPVIISELDFLRDSTSKWTNGELCYSSVFGASVLFVSLIPLLAQYCYRDIRVQVQIPCFLRVSGSNHGQEVTFSLCGYVVSWRF